MTRSEIPRPVLASSIMKDQGQQEMLENDSKPWEFVSEADGKVVLENEDG